MTNKMTQVFDSTKTFMSKHSPEILTGLGITGMITTTVLAVKVTPKAVRLIEAKKKELKTDELTIKETVFTTWKLYLPAASICATSIACLIGATTISSKRNAALATAYSISNRAFKTYKEKVIETIGEKKERDIRQKIAQDEVNKGSEDQRQIIITSKGQTLCMDSWSGRYFRSDLDTIRKAVNELNRSMTYHNYVSLNEYYYAIGLEQVKHGDYMGWNIDRGLIELDFSATITDTDEPCIVISYDIGPKEGYDR